MIRNEEDASWRLSHEVWSSSKKRQQKCRPPAERPLPGKVVFRLYDTFGFPPDLTADMAREAGLFMDQAGFDEEMGRQRQMARQSWEGMQGEDAAP